MTYQTEIEEAVIATYPVDLFPDNETAKAMRKMAPAIASIVLPVIERAVEAERGNIPVGFLRQWINEDRTHEKQKMVTDEDIMRFINLGYSTLPDKE